MSIATRYGRVAAEVAGATEAAGRNPAEVRLIAVSKTVDCDGAAEAFAAGARDFGENRPDSLLAKATALPNATWHFIGNIQSRRIPDIVSCASMIHSLFQESHAQKINDAAAKLGKVQDVLVEVNVSGEESKSGLAPKDVPAFVEMCCALPNVRVRGLMTMAPRADEATARATFEGLSALADKLRAGMTPEQAAVFNELSMGMSEDWRIAVASNATMVRIGRAIFDEAFE